MKRVKGLSLILGIIMIMVTATGCMQFDIGLEFNSDNTGKVTSISPLTYEEDGSVYKGGKSEAILSDITAYIEANEDMKLIDLPNGLKRLEMDFVDKISEGIEDEDGSGDASILSMLKMTGVKMHFTLKTDYKVVNHNATRVENGIYIWDLLEMAIEEYETGKEIEGVFLEYEIEKKETTSVEEQPIIKGFKDVSKTHWAYNDIMTLVNKGIISGVKPAGGTKVSQVSMGYNKFIIFGGLSNEKNKENRFIFGSCAVNDNSYRLCAI